MMRGDLKPRIEGREDRDAHEGFPYMSSPQKFPMNECGKILRDQPNMFLYPGQSNSK
jgi:hypothetical protein